MSGRRSVRFRVTLAATTLFAVALALASFALVRFVHDSLSDDIARTNREQLDQVAQQLRSGTPPADVRLPNGPDFRATGPNGIFHDDTAESYVVISGGGTLITGGTIENGRRSGANDEVTTILNGPSCAGTMVGFTSRNVKVGDVIIIPEHVPHGFSAIPDHVTYLSVRPDLKKVLQHGYVNPALTKK